MRVTEEEKEWVKNKANKLGYHSMTAFLMHAAETQIQLTVDMKVYRDLTKEINYIGKNINNLIRHIYTQGIYADSDIDLLKANQEKIWDLINKQYDKLLSLGKDFTSEKISLESLEGIAATLEKEKLEIPKRFVLEEIYEGIKNDFLYLIEVIKKSPEQEEDVVEYLFEYLYGDTLFQLEDAALIAFSDELFSFTQKIKFKMMKLEYHFDDDDWFELKDILDEYEIY
jgi:hypothetical protein